MVTEIAGMNETVAASIFVPISHFVLGCQFASLVIDTFLAGVLCMQVYHYFTYQWNDRTSTKLVVGYTFAMNWVVTCYYWAYTQYLLVQNFGTWLPWLEVRWLKNMPLFDAMTVCVVQVFFAHRAFLLTKRNRAVYGITLLLILTAFGAAMGTTIVFGQQSSLLGAGVSGPPLITWLATTTAADVLIAGSILYGLLHSKTGWAHTDKLVSRLIRLTFECQLPPTLLAIAYVAEWIVQPDSLLGAVFQALQCKAYTVGLLFALNARISITSMDGTDNQTMGPQIFGMSTRHNPTQIEVQVDTETFVHGTSDVASKKDGLESISDIENDKILGYSSSRARLTEPEIQFQA